MIEEKDVNAESSTADEQVVDTEQATTQETEQVDSQESSTQEVKPELKPDRPEINYAMEAARKASEALEIAKQLRESQTQQVQQPKYTKAQLQAYLQTPNIDTDQKIWALEEVDKIEKAERKQEMEKLFDGYTQKTQGDIQRQQSHQWFAQTFPECFVRDANGGIIGVDNTNPLVHKVNEYMSVSELAKNPRGLEVAVKMAAFDLGIQQNKNLQRKVNLVNAQLKREQKKGLIAGGGIQQKAGEQTQSKRIQQLAEEYRKTGNKDAFRELAKARGLVPQL
jgi:hypothetical protein